MLFDMPHFYLWLLPLINLFFYYSVFSVILPQNHPGFALSDSVVSLIITP